MTIINGKPFDRGARVVTTREVSHYVTIPAGTYGEVESWSGPHATANGGGYDVTIRLDIENPAYASIANGVDAVLAECAERDPEFYTLRFRAWHYGRITVRSTNLREV